MSRKYLSCTTENEGGQDLITRTAWIKKRVPSHVVRSKELQSYAWKIVRDGFRFIFNKVYLEPLWMFIRLWRVFIMLYLIVRALLSNFSWCTNSSLNPYTSIGFDLFWSKNPKYFSNTSNMVTTILNSNVSHFDMIPSYSVWDEPQSGVRDRL
jgi:hypothetical protein